MKTTDEMLDTESPESPTEKIRGPNFDTGLHDDAPLNWFDYLKYIWSTCVTLGSVAIILFAISRKAYVLPTPVPAAYIIAIVTLCLLFYLEGLMIAIVGTQYWDPEMFREEYPRAYKLHLLMNKPNNVKRFIIGRQFFTVLTNFVLAQIFTFTHLSSNGFNPILFYIAVQSGLVGVFVILSFAQLQSELLAAEFPLRFMNMRGSFSICYIGLVFDAIGVGHAAWTVYFITRYLCCRGHIVEGKVNSEDKPKIVRVQSAEVLAITKNSNTVV